ncbi:MAG: Gldg family protein [Planctomycetota bacterium]|nr:Gldg family protein [Planctomycetota bacterium]
MLVNDSGKKMEGSWGALQRVGSWANTVAMVALLMTILVGVNYLAYRHPWRKDMTFARIYTLDAQTRDVVARVDKDVEIAICFIPDLEINRGIYAKSCDLLEEYARANRRISLERLNILNDPARARELAERYKFTTKELPVNSVIFFSEGQKRTLDFMELYEGEVLGPGEGERIRRFRGEQLFTSAVLSVAEGKARRVYWDHGHGSPAFKGRDPRGFDGVIAVLADLENCDVQPLTLTMTDTLPDDCELYVIAGTTRPFVQRELDMIDSYLESGGKLLVFLDPFSANGLEGLLRNWGVGVMQNYVIDMDYCCRWSSPEGEGGNPAWILMFEGYGMHPIVKDMNQRVQTMFWQTCGLEVVTSCPKEVESVSLMNSSTNSWGKASVEAFQKNLWQFEPGKDRLGPLPLAIAASAQPSAKGKPYEDVRIVVVGDSDMIRNAMPLEIPDQLGFFLNCTRWLLEREATIRIPPIEPHDPSIRMTEGRTRFVFIVSIIVLPGLAVLLGIFVWLKRRV